MRTRRWSSFWALAAPLLICAGTVVVGAHGALSGTNRSNGDDGSAAGGGGRSDDGDSDGVWDFPSWGTKDNAASKENVHPLGFFHTLPSLACFFKNHWELPDGNDGTPLVETSPTPGARGHDVSPCLLMSVEPPALFVSVHSAIQRLRALQYDSRGSDRHRRDVQYKALADDGGGGCSRGRGLMHEDAVMRLLTLQRNTKHGGIQRMTGVFDVLAISRETAGLCRTADCRDLSAIDRVSSSSPWPQPGAIVPEYSSKRVVALRGAARIDDINRPVGAAKWTAVSVMDAGLLSLGRAVLADPSWLHRAYPWNDTLGASVQLIVEPSGRSDDALPSGLATDLWGLRQGDYDPGQPPRWLQAVAYVLCGPPTRSFVAAEALCEGLTLPQTSPPTLSPTRTPSAEAAILRHRTATRGDTPSAASGPALSVVGRLASWNIIPAPWTSEWLPSEAGWPLPAATDAVAGDSESRPSWTAGAGAREINSDSAEEVALAKRLGVAFVPSNEPGGGSDGGSALEADNAGYENVLKRIQTDELRRLSQNYDQSVFGKEPPHDPVDTSELLLAIIVVLPEAVALLVLLVSTREWRRRDLWVLFFVFLSGLVSMAGIVALAVREAAGAAWRAASVRDALTVHVRSPETTNFTGMALSRTETLLMVARPGYRVRFVRNVAAGMASIYLAFSASMAGFVWALRWMAARRRQGGHWGVGGEPGRGRRMAAAVAAATAEDWLHAAVRSAKRGLRFWPRPSRLTASRQLATTSPSPSAQQMRRRSPSSCGRQGVGEGGGTAADVAKADDRTEV